MKFATLSLVVLGALFSINQAGAVVANPCYDAAQIYNQNGYSCTWQYMDRWGWGYWCGSFSLVPVSGKCTARDNTPYQ